MTESTPAIAMDQAKFSASAKVPSTTTDHDALPPLMRDRSFWGLTVTQFLGAFNDNLFKQLMLLLAVPILASSATGATDQDQQGLAMFVFSIPFVFFSGLAGYLADRYSKRTVMVLSKVAEIAVMLLGLVGFLAYGMTGYGGLLFVLFLMGTQSTFFGPSKYGILPELFRGHDLPRANGIILMTTFMAIILGTASAGVWRDFVINPAVPVAENAPRLWVGALACVGIAIVGTLTSLFIRYTRPAVADLQFQPSSLAIPPDTRAMLRSDRRLVMALLATCMFWLVSGLAMQVVNYVGINEMGFPVEKASTYTSLLAAVMSIGIAIGAVVAGRLCHGQVNFRIVRIGAWGLVLSLVVLGLYRADGRQLLSSYQLEVRDYSIHATVPVLILLGASAGFFAIPVQVFLQARPPEGQKGRMIAVMNQANFLAIAASGFFYALFDRLVNALGIPHTPIFIMTALLILPVALFYRPKDVAL